MPCPKSEIST